jgi:hypothetical protein
MSEHLDQQSLLDWLRPDSGFRTDVAIVSTYPASAGVLASLLLSLAGHEDDPSNAGARATRVKFARSVTQLRGRVAIAMQAGRLFCSRKSGKPVALLDRFIKEIPWDEKVQGGKSWHPKCAIVRYSVEGSAAGRWRFWLGSRNLTRDVSWDLGLSLETGRGFPGCPPGLKSLIAVAPFMDVKTPVWVGRWGDEAQRVLVSTGQEMNRLAAGRSGFFEKQGFGDVRAFPSVSDAGEQDVIDQADGTAGDIETNRGLHAKFLWAEHTGGATIWLGSPNLTQRAWTRNAEIFACVGAASTTNALAELRDGVEKFANMAPAFSVSAVDEQSDVEQQMEFARKEVAARLMKADQRLSEDWERVEIVAQEAPHPSSNKFVLKVAPVADDLDQMVVWPPGTTTAELHPQHPNAASHLIRIKLECRNGPSVTWLQSIPIVDLPQDRRDSALLCEYLDDDPWFAWIYQTLTGSSEGAEGGAWDDPEKHRTGVRRRKRKSPAPTLEQLLRAWLKGRSSFEEVHKILAIRGAGASAGAAFDSFKKSLDLIENSLNGKQQP